MPLSLILSKRQAAFAISNIEQLICRAYKQNREYPTFQIAYWRKFSPSHAFFDNSQGLCC